jgi:glutathione S-transferase
MAITLYDAPRCPFCARARIVLAEKNVPYETVVIDLSDRPSWLYEKNPLGKVPELEDDGWVLPESAVIAEYLEERYPEPALLPADPAERAIARLLVFRFDEFSDPYYAFRRGDEGGAERFGAEIGHLDELLRHMPYLTGRAYGLADIDYVPWVLRARDLFGFPLDAYPAVTDWLERLVERPAIAAELDVVAALAA